LAGGAVDLVFLGQQVAGTGVDALGQQRVVEIARALAGQPAALLLDEPAPGC